MKKILLSILLIFILSFIFTPEAQAIELDLVEDLAGVLSAEQSDALLKRAEAVSSKYRCDVMIITVEEMTDNDGAYLWARHIYEDYNLGYGDEKSGILLFLSIAERDYALIAYGFGNTAFTDYGKDIMLDNHILPLLRNNRYYDAFSAYIDKAEEFLSMARDGTPFDRHNSPEAARNALMIKLAVVILLPLLIAFLICSVWKGQMKTARPALTACNYIPPGGFQLTASADTFLYQTRTQVKIERSSSSGGTSTDSRGFSGRSGKF